MQKSSPSLGRILAMVVFAFSCFGLLRTFTVVNHLFNLLAYNPNGREPAGKEGREEGYLFHFAWLAHQSIQIFSGQDANGVFRPLVTGSSCTTIRNTAASAPGAEFLLGLTGVLKDPRVCGETVGGLPTLPTPRGAKVKAKADEGGER